LTQGALLCVKHTQNALLLQLKNLTKPAGTRPNGTVS